MNLYIPDKTQALLDAHHANGTRHEAMKAISFSLIGNQWPPEMVFTLLRNKFNAPDIPDHEIRSLIDGAELKSPTPSGYGDTPRPHTQAPTMAKRNPPPADAKATDTLTNDERVQRALWWLADNKTLAADLPAQSPVEIPSDPAEAAVLFLRSLYNGEDRLNLVTKRLVDADGKARPLGGGKTLTRTDWTAWIEEKGVPFSDAGCWFRFNPCAEVGTGRDGATTDADITAHCFVLVESDLLDMDTQASILTRLDIPVAAITASGDKSAHALVMVEAQSAAEYKAVAGALLDALFRIGFDRANRNPSRLSRIPGATRQIKTTGDGVQRLLYLNPNCKRLTTEGVAALVKRLERPRFPSKPMVRLIRSALARYTEFSQGIKPQGIKTGFETFDTMNGGLRAGLYYIVAAQTNIGKSSWALNVISNAIGRNEGVALFSLEMLQEDIVDMLYSNRAGIVRDTWNTGIITEHHMGLFAKHSPQLADSPLWIFDDPDQTIEHIRETATALAEQSAIKLIVVDYMQFVAPMPGRENREQQVSIVSRGLKALAKTTGVPVLGISALNDDGKMRESRGSGYDCDAALTLEESGDDELIGRVVKGRFIKKRPYIFRFCRETCRMTDGGIYDESKASDDGKASRRKFKGK